LAEAQRRFAAFLADPGTLAPALRDPVIALAGRRADRATWEMLRRLAEAATGAEERVRYYSALAGARDPALAAATLPLVLSEELPSTIASQLLFGVAGGGEQRALAWRFVEDHVGALSERLGPYFAEYSVPRLLAGFADAEHAEALLRFAPAQEREGGRIAV